MKLRLEGIAHIDAILTVASLETMAKKFKEHGLKYTPYFFCSFDKRNICVVNGFHFLPEQFGAAGG